MLSRIENKLSAVTEDFVDRAAAVYELPSSFFAQPDAVLGAPVSVHPIWRKRSTVSAREMDQIVAELNLRVMHMRRLLQAVDIEAIAGAQRAIGVGAPGPTPGVLVVGGGRGVAAALRAAGWRAAGHHGASADVAYAAETGWSHLLDVAAGQLITVATGAAVAIPADAIAAATAGDGAALATIFAAAAQAAP